MKIDYKPPVELACRWYVFIFLNLYGIGKIIGQQFYRKGKIPEDVAQTTLEEASSFGLAWTFMGYSNAYILFIGISQVIGAWLLLWNKTKISGVIILFPIMVNIIMFDIIFLDKYGALASAIIYFLMLMIILLLNQGKLITALESLIFSIQYRRSFKEKLPKFVLALLIMAVAFVVNQLIVESLGHGRG